VVVKVTGCGTREGVLISGVKKQTESIQNFPVRFPNGDVRNYRGDQLLLRGKQAPLMEFICAGDVIFTKQTLGVVRFIGLHEDYVGTVIVIEPIDPKLPNDPNVDSFRKQFPSASLSDSRAYNILRKREEILKILPPDILLLQLSKIKDKYLAFLEESRETARAFEEDMSWRNKKITEIENDISLQKMENDVGEQEKEKNTADNSFGGVASPQDDTDENNTVQLIFDPGRLGIKALWESGKVEGVSEGEQAEKLGVQVGWVIVKVGEEEYSEERLDSKVAGDSSYTLTFQVLTGNDDEPEKTASKESEQTIPPPSTEVPLKEMITTESEREKYERKIRELEEQIEDFQYAIEDLQTKNSNLENEHKELPTLRTKVKQLRSSKVMFQGQIKEVQKRQRDWRKKAEENEKEFKKLTQKPSYNKKLRQKSLPNKSEKGKHVRRSSAKMPRPDASNTVSLSARSLPGVGDGSSETLSLSNLNTDKKNSKRNNKKKTGRKSWFGNNNRS